MTGSSAIADAAVRRHSDSQRTTTSEEPLCETGRPLENATIEGESYFVIRNVDAMPAFFMSIVSDTDLWAFVGSNGSFTAGRQDPDHALFPYQTVDKILASPETAGALSIFHVETEDAVSRWEPWRNECGPHTERHLYKHALGTSVVFEEIRHDLGLRFRWSLELSERYGLVRQCELANLSETPTRIRSLDGFHHLLPAGVNEQLYSRYSYLACAYMRHERADELGIFTLNAGVSDKAEPCESLRAACAWSIGHQTPQVLLSNRQVAAFRSGQPVHSENVVRGEFGAWLVADTLELAAGKTHRWACAADTSLDHASVAALHRETADSEVLSAELAASLRDGRLRLRARVAASDGLQSTAEHVLDAHHFANTVFNCMRGGVPNDGYTFPASDFAAFLQSRNRRLTGRFAQWLQKLPAQLDNNQLQELARDTGDVHLIRLAGEYLPLLFSRRHGDPSRPWNRFSIRLREDDGSPAFGYQGNWRDIFQNWESLAQSYPGFLENMISVFLNASTADGYNPYRITRNGIDWEVLDPEDPWSQIGYWGDHQIVYLSRLLESLENHAPGRLSSRLGVREFSSAAIPYEIHGFEELVRDPRHSIHFDLPLHRTLLERAGELGNDGKLLAGPDGEPFLFSLAEKLLVPVLAKLSNLVPGGGIWLNTQRPEWNDANNALAGWGLSVVTVFQLRRHLVLLRGLFANATGVLPFSAASAAIIAELTAALRECPSHPDDTQRMTFLRRFGAAGETHRRFVYSRETPELRNVSPETVCALLDAALAVVESTLAANFREDGLVHSYNLLAIHGDCALVGHLDLMLEGQVAAIGSGFLDPKQVVHLLEAMTRSALYREDQHSYMLQPDRAITPFLSRNKIPANIAERSKLLRRLVAEGDRSLVLNAANGVLHFHPDFTNTADLELRLGSIALRPGYEELLLQDRDLILDAWEAVFKHRSFMGRSGAIFGFEGLGSIYWHMVAKLLLAVQEAHDQCTDSAIKAQLALAYADVRNGLGFRKTPDVYGAFPTDPYSHTPRHRGAQQPGMTGQVKEEILTRFGELGIKVRNGSLSFEPQLMEPGEFLREPGAFKFVDSRGTCRELPTPADSVAFTYCQVPVIYHRAKDACVSVEWTDGTTREFPGTSLPAEISREIFNRTHRVANVKVGVRIS